MVSVVYESIVIRKETMMEVMVIDRCHRSGWSGLFPILNRNIFLGGFFLQYTNFLRLSEKESAIMRCVTPVHVSEKQGDIKTASILTILPHSLGPRRWLNWLNGWNRETDCFNEYSSDNHVIGWSWIWSCIPREALNVLEHSVLE